MAATGGRTSHATSIAPQTAGATDSSRSRRRPTDAVCDHARKGLRRSVFPGSRQWAPGTARAERHAPTTTILASGQIDFQPFGLGEQVQAEPQGQKRGQIKQHPEHGGARSLVNRPDQEAASQDGEESPDAEIDHSVRPLITDALEDDSPIVVPDECGHENLHRCDSERLSGRDGQLKKPCCLRCATPSKFWAVLNSSWRPSLAMALYRASTAAISCFVIGWNSRAIFRF